MLYAIFYMRVFTLYKDTNIYYNITLLHPLKIFIITYLYREKTMPNETTSLLQNTFFSNRYASTQYPIPYTKKMINNDADAYKAFPKHKFVYNKLWVTKSQNLKCGRMNEPPSKTQYPVFIKPIINLQGGNADCYQIRNEDEFQKYSHREDMFWCELLQGQEGSTDFILHNGKIVFQLSYVIDQEQDTFLQEITKISAKNVCPEYIIQWLFTHLHTYSGAVNIQYIGDKIIECGLRFDSKGHFIQYTNNQKIIQNINHYFDTREWRHLASSELDFQDTYLYTCSKSYPIIYYIPAPLILLIQKSYSIQHINFYIDETKDKIIFLDIVDTNTQKLVKCKRFIEGLMNVLNVFFLVGFAILFLILGFVLMTSMFQGMWGIRSTQKISYTLRKYILSKNAVYIYLAFLLLYFTRFLNPPKYLRRMF